MSEQTTYVAGPDDVEATSPLGQLVLAIDSAAAVERQLLDALDTWYGDVTAGRTVRSAEDTFAVQRQLGAMLDKAKALKAAFEGMRKHIGTLQEAELVEVAGEQDGLPNLQTLTVPDADGDIRLTVKSENKHFIDVDRLVPAIVASYFDTRDAPGERTLAEQVTDVVNGDDAHIPPENLPGLLAESAIYVVHQVLGCGKFDPQISKVKAFADQVSRDGDDVLSGVVRDSIRTNRVAKGVEMTRKAPK